MSDKSEDRNLSVEEIESKIRDQPNDTRLREDLAYAVLIRYLDNERELSSGDETDIKYLRRLVADLSEDTALFPRAYLAYLDHKEGDAIAWLVKYATHTKQKGQIPPPLTSDELLTDIISPFNTASNEFWLKLAEKFGEIWPESAMVFTLQGHGKVEADSEEALDYFVRALNTDKDYWLAALECAEIYYMEKNWRAACGYFYKALNAEAEWAQKIPDVHFYLAWCLGKLKKYEEEEKYYRSCLGIDPNYPYARNNLGWSLLKQDKNEEALEVFEKSIQDGNDGKYPLYNKARVLKKLGRFPDAIKAFRKTARGNKLNKWVQEEISQLQDMTERQLRKEPIDETQIATDYEEEGIVSEEVVSVKIGSKIIVTQIPTQTEQLLEEMIEKRIQQGSEVFGRKLLIYDPPEGPYGRQYAIPGVGRIDLLTEDVDTHEFVVIELKRDEGHDQVVGQISLYMSWVRENLTKKDQRVIGIICIYSASNKLLLAARNVQNLEVFEYGLTFQKVC